MLNRQTQQDLLTLARAALEARVRRARGPQPAATDTILPRRGAFVTIFCKGELRGCLGRITSDLVLPELVCRLAEEVADSDPRFVPVTLGELGDVDLEISVLTPEWEIRSIDEIEVGRHGLIVEHGANRGLLLPQVPVEHGWDRDTFVGQACVKAGLPPDAWKRGAHLFIFEAQVFGEE
jgi:AmmeMemoRadiSam system protein A